MKSLESFMLRNALNRPVEKRVIGEPAAFNYVTTFEYDDGAHAVIQTDPRGIQMTTHLDGFDRTHRVEQEAGVETLVTTTFYDASGNPKRTRMRKDGKRSSSTTV